MTGARGTAEERWTQRPAVVSVGLGPHPRGGWQLLLIGAHGGHTAHGQFRTRRGAAFAAGRILGGHP